MNLFDIVGPIMIGPSSSHTAGAARIAWMARQLLAEPVLRAKITLFGSFAKTCLGHGTVKAIVGGLLGFTIDDARLRDSFDFAREAGMEFALERSEEVPEHANTAELRIEGATRALNVRGCSLGGGAVRLTAVEGVPVRIESGQAGLVVFHTDARGVLAALTAALSVAGINIAGMSDFRKRRAGEAISIFTIDQKPEDSLVRAIQSLPYVSHAVWLDGQVAPSEADAAPLTLNELAQSADIPRAVYAREGERTGLEAEDIRARLRECLAAMRQSVAEGEADAAPSQSGLSGGDAAKVGGRQAGPLGSLAHAVLVSALAVSEGNARMGRIVALPTAGSCGILPAVLFAVGERVGADEEALVSALCTAAGIGLAVAAKASIAGAEGGCQAECGTAAAMAAGAATQLLGGSPEAIVHAAALTIKSMLGLVCDPVAGLVEVPCVKRNAFSAMSALTGCELALAGVRSKVDPDEVLDAMRDVGRRLPIELKETAMGGLALSGAAKEAQKRLEAE